MCSTIGEIVSSLHVRVKELSDAALDATECSSVVAELGEARRLLDAAQTIVMQRVADTGAWRSSVYRSSAQWLAAQTGSSLSEAISTVQTAAALGSLPSTRDALVAGALSGAQLTQVAAAASVDPSAEASLLSMAASGESVGALREKARAVVAAAQGDELSTERIHRTRYLKHWIEADGAVRLDARLAPDVGGRVIATLRARAERLYKQARAARTLESRKTVYWADALAGLADGKPGPKALVNVVVSAEAYERGYTLPGEECVVEGAGPISVTAARQLAGDGIVRLIEHNGVDVQRIATEKRTIRASVRTALERRRGGKCEVIGCDARDNLEVDHILGYEITRKTKLSDLALLCHSMHVLKTHHGYELGGSPGARTLTKPERAPP